MASGATSSTAVAIALLLGLAVAGTLIQELLFARRRSLRNFPRVGIDPGFLGRNLAAAKKLFSTQGHRLLKEAYNESQDAYIVQTEDMPRIILSPKFLPELDMLPETTLSHRESIALRHLGSYTDMDIVLQSHLHSDICRVQLRRNLPKFLPAMASTVERATAELLSNVGEKEFQPIPPMAYSFSVTSRIFSQVFVGEPLCNNTEWMQAIEEYPKVMVSVATALRPWSPRLRPIVSPFIRQTKALQAYQDKLHKLFDPILDSRRQNKSRHDDALQWLINLAAPHEADNHSVLLKLMFLTLAAIHTSAMALDHMLLDLCERPEYLSVLRQEIRRAVASTDGRFTLDVLSDLPKLDSFMQESRRVNHPAAQSQVAFHRRVMKDVQLSTGLVIPEGWIISMPAEAMAQDTKYYSEPAKFDAERFLPTNAKGNGAGTFSSILSGNLSWGHGRFTCPGRWYAEIQIKLILAKTILKYDVRLPDGKTERPANFHMDERITPDPRAMIEIKEHSE